MFSKRVTVPANRIASALTGHGNVAQARDLAWRQMETASNDSDYRAAADAYLKTVAR